MNKSYPKSFFIRFHLKSQMAECIFNDNPRYKRYDVVVIQVMMCDGMEVIAELISKNDYNEIIEKEMI